LRGEILHLKETLNTMGDQLNRFAGGDAVSRGRHRRPVPRGHANVPGVAVTWKYSDRQRELDGGNLTAQVRNIGRITTLSRAGDLSARSRDGNGEFASSRTHQTMVTSLPLSPL